MLGRNHLKPQGESLVMWDDAERNGTERMDKWTHARMDRRWTKNGQEKLRKKHACLQLVFSDNPKNSAPVEAKR